MSTALYRRYRPESFADVIGQEHVTDPLMQALRTGRTNHAYLFSGPRGCGKTTSARILARCLNCEQGPTPTPCGQCQSCVALARGGSGSVDVIEIDAASHGGVDDARDLREKASYGPAQSRYKVYIIDEAHMVTPQGFNALLKIVEEPPEHVKFIFATTEPEKVIGTIRSRTHHYPFRLVPPARLQEYLEELCAREGVAVEPGVLSFVIRAGGGSVRDSLSVLDQLIAGSDDDGLTYAGAAALLGFTEAELLDATVDAFAASDGAAVFRQIDRIIETGQDPRRFVEDLLERLRDLIVVAALASAGGDGATAIFRGLPQDQLDRMQQQAAAFGPGELSYAADTVNTGLTEMTGATSPRLQLELICARLLLPRAAGEHGFAARIDRLEQRLEMAGPQPPSRPRGGPPPAVDAAPSAAAAARAVTPEADAPSAPTRQASPVVDPAAGAEPEQGSARPTAGVAEAPAPAAVGGDAPQGSGRVRPERSGSGPSATSNPPTRPAAPVVAESAGEVAAPAAPTHPPRGGLDTDALRRAWPDVLAKVFGIRRVTWTFLSEHAQVLDYDGERLLIGIATRGLAQTFRNGQHGEVVRQALIDARGIDTRVEGVALDDAAAATSASRSTSGGSPSGAGRSGGADAGRVVDGSRPGRSNGDPDGGAPNQGGAHDNQPATGPRDQRSLGGHAREGGWGEDAGRAPSGAVTPGPVASDRSHGQGGREGSGGAAPVHDSDDPHDRAESHAAEPTRPEGSDTAARNEHAQSGGEGPRALARGAAGTPVGRGALPSPGDDPSTTSWGAASPTHEARDGSDSREQPGGAAQPPAGASSPERPTPWGGSSDLPPPDEPPDDDVPPEDDDPRVRPETVAPATPPTRAGAGSPSARPAQGGRRPAEEPSSTVPAPEAPARPAASPSAEASAGASRRGIEAFRAARRAQRDRGSSEGAAGGSRVQATGVADDEVARDDEDITDLSAVGQPVIAAVLGGTVIGEIEE